MTVRAAQACGIALLLVVGMLVAQQCLAHDSRPILIDLQRSAADDAAPVTSSAQAGSWTVRWKVPDSVAVTNAPVIELSANCTAAADSRNEDGAAAAVPAASNSGSLSGQRWYRCARPALPQYVQMTYPVSVPSLATLVRIEDGDLPARTVYAGPGALSVALPESAGRSAVLASYGRLGFEHILLGFDHLLFVGALVLLAGTLKRIALAVTGFTLAHSLTLGAAALGLVRLPIVPVETVIALSIVFLAAELARGNRDTLTWRYPLLVASSFGLLHGFGFAAVLGEIGLPDRERLTALLAFNLGVELGQLSFVGLLVPLLAWSRARLASGDWTRLVMRPTAYVIGSLASFWTCERLLGYLG